MLHVRLLDSQRTKRLGSQYLLPRFKYTQIAYTLSAVDAVLKGERYPENALFCMAANPMLTEPDTSRFRAALKELKCIAAADLFRQTRRKWLISFFRLRPF